MARKRSFNEKDVLRAAAKTFSENGYAGTSIDQLVAATGLQRGSLYGAFGSKAGVFRAAFKEILSDVDADSADLLTDLLIVAMWERASVDKQIKAGANEASRLLERNLGEPITAIIYRRILLRSGI